MASFSSTLQRRRRSWPSTSMDLSLLVVINTVVCLSLMVRGKRCPVFQGARSSDAPASRAQSVLNEQIESFLSKGGEITEVPSGKSGWNAVRKKSQHEAAWCWIATTR
ncbi:hypothetical protein [Pseudomonas sp. Q1-7]|uniref:hypothetical protein n=1 Tax=Pseudomonas sp. Q1-7 TaxID=3020843 RepID=UPI002FE2F970